MGYRRTMNDVVALAILFTVSITLVAISSFARRRGRTLKDFPFCMTVPSEWNGVQFYADEKGKRKLKAKPHPGEPHMVWITIPTFRLDSETVIFAQYEKSGLERFRRSIRINPPSH